MSVDQDLDIVTADSSLNLYPSPPYTIFLCEVKVLVKALLDHLLIILLRLISIPPLLEILLVRPHECDDLRSHQRCNVHDHTLTGNPNIVKQI